MNRIKQLVASRYAILYVILFGLLVRAVYVIFVAKLIYANYGGVYVMADTFSFTDSIINFIEHGWYGFDRNNPESAFGRLPGYPVFWGLHYLMFGKEGAYVAVAVSQILLDGLAIYLVYRIVINAYGSRSAALFTSLIYATFFFIIIWNPFSSSEFLAAFFTILLLFVLSKKRFQSTSWYIWLALILGVCFYIREYLGILFPILVIYFGVLWLRKQVPFKGVFAFGITLVLFYALWPIRNYLSHGQVILLKPIGAGYERYQPDFNAFREWMYTWHTDVEPQLGQIVGGQPVDLPPNVFKDSSERRLFDSLLVLANSCGSSFHHWKTEQKYRGVNCNSEIEKGFLQLKRSFIERQPLTNYVKIPGSNLLKTVFKNDVPRFKEKGKAIQGGIFLLFLWRTILVISGILGCILFWRRNPVFPIVLLFFGLLAFYLSFFLRQVEMRYLVQTDVCLLICGGIFLYEMGRRWVRRRSASVG